MSDVYKRDVAFLHTGQYFGSVSRSESASVFTARQVVHREARRLPAHGHTDAYFCLLVAGHYRERVGRREVSYRPFDCVYHPPQSFHRDEVGRLGATFLCLEIAPAAASDAELSQLLTRSSRLRLLDAGAVAVAARAYGEYASGTLCALSLESYGWDLLGSALSPTVHESGHPPWLIEAIDMLDASVEQGVTLIEIARAVQVHPVHLARTFRERLGRTAGHYLELRRVERACRLLSRDVPLAEIAGSTGFADQSHFTRTFKRVIGVSPGRYRRIIDVRSAPPQESFAARAQSPRS